MSGSPLDIYYFRFCVFLGLVICSPIIIIFLKLSVCTHYVCVLPDGKTEINTALSAHLTHF